MNFFEQQERARRHTGLLVLYFFLAVALIVAAVDAVIVALVYFHRFSHARFFSDVAVDPRVLLWASVGNVVLIGSVSLVKMAELSSGGGAVAALLGGRAVAPDTQDPGERRLLNVVEEMSLAAGMAVPAVYVLPSEKSINAFAAGFSPARASVTVSRGALDALTRDELQGVVAHEFSHIFNGDMSLNLRLMGLLSGILAIAMIGRGLLQAKGRRTEASAGLVGLALFAIGYIGVFFAQLIKSAISRQREFLADASAVQFTRNPDGILGALIKIRDGAGSLLDSHHAESVSHLLFASGLEALFATHPPLEERLRAIDPSFAAERKAAARIVEEHRSPPQNAAPAAALVSLPTAALVAASVGKPTAEGLAQAARFVSSLPESVAASLRTAPGARAAVYSLLLDQDADVRARQESSLGEEALAASGLAAALAALGPSARFPAVQLAVSALRALSAEEKEGFLSRVHALVIEDNRVDPFELLLELFLRRSLTEGPTGASGSFRAALPSILTALGFLAGAGAPGRPASAATAFRAGVLALDPFLRTVLPPLVELSPAALADALDVLAAAEPDARRRAMEACAACVLADGDVRLEEWETLVVFAAAMDCPLPPSVASIS